MKKKAYVKPQMTVIGLKMSHGLLAGSSINMDVYQEFELEVDEDSEDPYCDAEEAD